MYTDVNLGVLGFVWNGYATATAAGDVARRRRRGRRVGGGGAGVRPDAAVG